MILLALMPSVSVLAVSARAAAYGFSHGLFTALGIVAGDIVFILIAVYGLVFVAELMGERFRLIQIVGGLYLLWLGLSLWCAEAKLRQADAGRRSTWSSSFLTGLLITLGDQKAILFYLGFFPAFVDLASLTPADTLIIVAIAALGVGGAKLVYAWLADRASLLIRDARAVTAIQRFAAAILFAVGATLLLKSAGLP